MVWCNLRRRGRTEAPLQLSPVGGFSEEKRKEWFYSVSENVYEGDLDREWT